MKTQEWEFIDKSTWGPGPWQEEKIDKMQWQDEATGLPCLAIRHKWDGNWCGYVGVSSGHPLFGMDYYECDVHTEVHFGISFTGFCVETDKEHSICHVVEPGEDDKVWWIGFSCGEFQDLRPGYEARYNWGHLSEGMTYKNLEYVKGECRNLAQQLAAMKVDNI